MSYRTVMAVDLQGYGSRPQNVQAVLQANLVECLRDAAGNAGLDAAGWEDRGGGGGRLMVLPHDVRAEVLVGRFVRELNAELRGRNRVASAEARTRMRLAIHHGPAAPAAGGYSGSAPVVVRGLCGADPLRAALDAAGTDLGVIVSAFVFRGSVEAGMTSLDPADLRRVRVPGLAEEGDGWVWFPGGPDPHALDFPDGLAGRPPAGPPTAPPSETPPSETPPSEGAPSEGAPSGSVHATTINARTFVVRDQVNYNFGGRS
ncbi:hypothetical protein [Actinomadura formosensis]|uniref:hypothetical protein n=1 Tax=Actinomadura formosensis TaxID=60706 RepID=UPI00082B8F48|nr:hypothetical protein [Actinomadura formosensis]